MKIRTLRTYLTRDMPLIAAQCWYKGGADCFQRQFGIIFPFKIYLYRNGVFEFQRDPKGFEIDMPKQLSKWIRRNDDKIPLLRQKMKNTLDYFKSIRATQKTSVLELFEYLKEVGRLFEEGFGDMVIAHHIPEYNRRFMREGIRLLEERIIKKLVQWREAESDVFFSEGVSKIESLLAEIARRKRWRLNLLKFITLEELEECVMREKPLPITILKKRSSSVFMYSDYRCYV